MRVYQDDGSGDDHCWALLKMLGQNFMKKRIHRMQQAGLTLIEVLIALLVLSLGLAGLATLYLISLASVHSGLLTSLSSSIALDFEERLWVEVGRAGDGSCPVVSTVIDELESDWSRSDQGFLSLPGSFSVAAGTVIPGERFQEIPVTVTWSENRFVDAENGALEQFEYTVRIYCTP